MNNLSRWAIHHPIPTIVLFLVLTVAGIFGYAQLRINNNPDTDIPTVTVSVSQAGASPTELEVQVAKLVENAVAGLNGIDSISSSLSDGLSVTNVQFALGTDINQATSDVQNAVSGIQSNLPAGANSTVQRVESTGNSILDYVVDAPSMNPEQLSWYVDNDLARALLGVPGVGSVQRSGGVDRIISVKLDPARLAALGISATQVSTALAETNINKPGGRVTLGDQENSVRTVGSAGSLQTLADTRVSLAGTTYRIADLGTVEDTWSEPRQQALYDSKPVVAFSVYRSVGASEVHTADTVREEIEEIGRDNPNVKIIEVSSSSDFAEESYVAAVESLLIGAALAVGIVLLFLRDFRATLVSAVAMPLSLIPTFVVMWLLGQSLNVISLLALSLVVGILVDDAIVEIENIVRHMRESGKTAFQAALEAADEIGVAVLATTATLIAIFVPVTFMPGVAGQFFKSFGIAVAVSVFFSLVVARMLTPLMAAYFVKADGSKTEDTPTWVPTYLVVLRLALRFRWVTLLLGFAFFVGSAFLATQLPTEFLTATDRGRSIISVQLPPGATLQQTEAIVLRVTSLLKDEPEVESVFAAIGSPTQSGTGPAESTSAGAVNTATITLNLVERSKRQLSQQQFEAANSPKFNTIPGVRLSFSGGGFSGAGVSVTLVGDDPAALTAASSELLKQMATIDGLSNPTSTDALTAPELLVTPDTARAAALGITATEIAQTVSIATLGDTGANLPKFNAGDRQLSVVVSVGEDGLRNADDIAQLPIVGSRGTVPLGAVATISYGAGPSAISRVDRVRQNTVQADLTGLTLGQATAEIEKLPIMQNLPDGVRELKQGDSERLLELFGAFFVVMAAGVMLMYLTLVLLFKSFLQPMTILIALPLSIGGALGFLYLTGHAMGLTALIAILMLMGIAAKNSILLVEYALVAMARGQSRLEALIDAATKRARPILMTSVAMGMGMLPIALGWGADAETRAPMAIAVIGGLVSSTLLSLVYVPVFFTFMDDLHRFLGHWLSKLLVEKQGDGDAPAAGRASEPDQTVNVISLNAAE